MTDPGYPASSAPFTSFWDNDDAFCDTHVLAVTPRRMFAFHLCNYLSFSLKGALNFYAVSCNKISQLSRLFNWYWTRKHLYFCLSSELQKMSSEGLVRYTGGCHCGAVKYEVKAPETLTVFHCKYVHCCVFVICKLYKRQSGDRNLFLFEFSNWPLVRSSNWTILTKM